VKTTIAQTGTYREAVRPKGAVLELGDHPMADTARSLGICRKPFVTRCFLERSAILPGGVIVERGVRRADGYPGKDKEGEHTVAYVGKDGIVRTLV
jgi:hypothetical protein